MTEPVVAVPIKPFHAAKDRLAESLSPVRRRRLSMALAEHTVEAVCGSGAAVLVLAATQEVAQWAESLGVPTLTEGCDSLNQASSSAIAHIDAQSGWVILHADLPLLEPRHLRPAIEHIKAGRWVIAASCDGGTNLFGGPACSFFEFSYGPGSFHRHLARIGRLDPLILQSIELALDLDHPSDLAAARSHPLGSWLAPLVG